MLFRSISFNLQPESKGPRNLRDREARRQAEQLALKLKATSEFMQNQIRLAQTQIKHFADQSQKPVPVY